jgi:hypothetical protein
MTYKTVFWNEVTRRQEERDCTPEEVADIEARMAAEPARQKDQLVARIDEMVAAVYNRWLRFDAEYVAREAAARQFLLDGTTSAWVTGFAEPAGLTEAQAATLIVQQADNLRSALETLGALRMRKYEVKAAASVEDAHAVADDITTQIDTVARGLQ